MRLSLSAATIAALAAIMTGSGVDAFATPTALVRRTGQCVMSVAAEPAAMAESGVPPAHSEINDAHVADDEIPTNLPSDMGMDYVPLATMLATGQLAEADQVCSMFKSTSVAFHFSML